MWANFKDLALQYGLRACWSTPIHGSDGKVLGTFANYYRFVRDPSPVDRELTDMITRTAAMAIEQDRNARHPVSAWRVFRLRTSRDRAPHRCAAIAGRTMSWPPG